MEFIDVFSFIVTRWSAFPR